MRFNELVLDLAISISMWKKVLDFIKLFEVSELSLYKVNENIMRFFADIGSAKINIDTLRYLLFKEIVNQDNLNCI